MNERRVTSVGFKGGIDINHDGHPDVVHIEAGDIHDVYRNKKGKKVEDYSTYRSLVPAIAADEKDSYVLFEQQDPSGLRPGEPKYGTAWLFGLGGIPFFSSSHVPFVIRQSVKNDGEVHTVKAFRVVVSERDETISVSEAKALLDNGKVVGLDALSWVDEKGNALRHTTIEALALSMNTRDTQKNEAQKPSASPAEISIAEFYAHVAKLADGRALPKDEVSNILWKDTHFKQLLSFFQHPRNDGLSDAVLEGAIHFITHRK